MNTEQNQKIWIEKIHENLNLRGRSENTFANYKSVLIRFFNFFDESTNIEHLSDENIIPYFNHFYFLLALKPIYNHKNIAKVAVKDI